MKEAAMNIDITQTPFRQLEHEADLCVVGGGMAGICAAVAAARHGAAVVLMQDRPVLGGNASGEIGVRVLGADCDGSIPYTRETGILEELRLLNCRHNPQGSLSVWDMVLHQFVSSTENLTLILNCSCLDAEMGPSTGSGQAPSTDTSTSSVQDSGTVIRSILGWQLSTQTWITVKARLFADCSGDAILALPTGAAHRMGREASSEFNESFAPEAADDKTMGMSYGYFARDHKTPIPHTAFGMEREFETCDDLPWGAGNHRHLPYSPWWCEMGGEHHSIHDSELLRDELFKHNLGLWNHIKNGKCEHRETAKTWALEKVTFVAGRRESRRYEGLHMLSQSEIEGGGHFDDVVCHGGWTMDDHHPGGCDSFRKYNAPPNIHHHAPSPYGIPYRCMVSKNIANLMFAGRVASCTHMAMSSTRIMGTCAVMGQVVGTAAALACEKTILPADVLDHIPELQQRLIGDDIFIPGISMELSEVTQSATLECSQGNAEVLRNGIHRPVSSDPLLWMRKAPWSKVTKEELATYSLNSWEARPGDWAAYRFGEAQRIESVTLILDSNLETAFKGQGEPQSLRPDMPKSFRVEVLEGREWVTLLDETENGQRRRRIPIGRSVEGVRFTLGELHGGESTQVYGFYLE
ncbi:MAG: FAD-dependent oxidoreductase [Planctomycetota bacterium]